VSPGPRLHPRGVLTVATACLLAFTAAVVVLGSVPADTAVREALLSVTTPGVRAVMRVVNHLGDWRGLLPGALLLFVVFPRARAQWWLWVGLMVAAPVTEWALKHLVGRHRPEALSLSFPSGHSTAAAAFFGALIYLAGALPPALCAWVRRLAALMIVLVGVARVMLRAHWPSDVLAGFALGLALAALASLLSERWSPSPAAGPPPRWAAPPPPAPPAAS
jgi:membrane-associated phospholipid phosphatase